MCSHLNQVFPMSPQLTTHLAKLDEIGAKTGFCAKHLASEQVIVYEAERRFLAASTIKLPVLALYAERRQEAVFAENYLYNPADDCEDSPCFDELEPGTAVSWDTLADWMMIRSDNTATNLLIEQLGMAEIQAWIAERGWQTMQLNRVMMDLAARARGIDNWSNAQEMLDFMERLVKRTLTDTASCDWILDVLHRCEDKEKIPFLFQPPVFVANKPGELPGNRSDVGYVHDAEHEVVMAIFCDGLPDEAAELANDLWQAELAQILWQELTIVLV